MIDLFCRYLSIQLHFTLFCFLPNPQPRHSNTFDTDFSLTALLQTPSSSFELQRTQNWTVFVSFELLFLRSFELGRADHRNCISDLSRPQEQPASTLSSFASFKTSFTSNVNFLKRRYIRNLHSGTAWRIIKPSPFLLFYLTRIF